MKLSELQDLINNANTMGFTPEEVEVKFTYTFSEMAINFVKSEVKAGQDVKPIVRIDLKC